MMLVVVCAYCAEENYASAGGKAPIGPGHWSSLGLAGYQRHLTFTTSGKILEGCVLLSP